VDPALFLSGHNIDAPIDVAATCPDGTPVPILRSRPLHAAAEQHQHEVESTPHSRTL